jgi:hypothetical protein
VQFADFPIAHHLGHNRSGCHYRIVLVSPVFSADLQMILANQPLNGLTVFLNPLSSGRDIQINKIGVKSSDNLGGFFFVQYVQIFLINLLG